MRLLGAWLLTTTLFLFRIDGPWSHQLWLYSGYLLLGYVLYQKLPNTKGVVTIVALLGALALIATVYMVVSTSVELGEYKVGRWLSYKTLNVVLAASMVFMLCRYFGEGLSEQANKVIGFISQHSLGIYILHPIFLMADERVWLVSGTSCVGYPCLDCDKWWCVALGELVILTLK